MSLDCRHVEKRNGPIRVGCGRYDWYFTEDTRCLIERAVITIDTMQQLPATELDPIMGWLAALPYPWCTPADALAPVKEYLMSIRPIAPAC